MVELYFDGELTKFLNIDADTGTVEGDKNVETEKTSVTENAEDKVVDSELF